MIRPFRRVTLVVFGMFVALMVASTLIQGVFADELRQDPRNVRTTLQGYDVRRGSILVAGEPIAESVPSGDMYQYKRVYPQGPLYSSVTGYFTLNAGRTGIESAMNDELSGTSGSQFFDTLNRIITGQSPQGDSVQLTIDPKVQQAAWDALGDYRGAIVAIEPSTGRVLAMVSKPTFDPNSLTGTDGSAVDAAYQALVDDPGKPLDNRAIAGDEYHPGSTFKVVMSASALSTGSYTTESAFPNPASLQLPQSSAVITNASGTQCGPGDQVSLLNALVLSCNIPFAELGMSLGRQQIGTTAQAFGFNKDLSIPLKVTPSIWPTLQSDAQTALASFGQEDVRATPLQIAMVSAAVANHGVLMKPQLVDSVIAPDLSVRSGFSAEQWATPVSPQVADTVRDMMVQVVSRPDGTSHLAAIPGVDVAGKTGTAENGPGDPYTLWFTGFAPANDPQVAVAVVVEDGGSGTSYDLTAPMGKQVIEAVLNR